MHDYLKSILKHKEQEVSVLRQSMIHESYLKYSGKKSFKKALQKGGVIAEIKRKSPSQPHIGNIPDPTVLAKRYQEGGAIAISVLTDSFGFNGSIEDLKKVVAVSNEVPVLRKDFIIDPLQIIESIHSGADAILLIVSVLKEKTFDLLQFARELNIDALVEVHDKKECDYAVSIGADIIGVNNRNLTTFEINQNCAIELVTHLPNDVVKVAESGMHSPAQVREYFDVSYHAVLVGEALVKSVDPIKFIKECDRE